MLPMHGYKHGMDRAMPVHLSEEDYNRGYFVVLDKDGATSPIESVPAGLTLRKEYDDKRRVFATREIRRGARFGPVKGDIVGDLPSFCMKLSCRFPIVDKRHGSLRWFVDTSETYNWMVYVSLRQSKNNLIACQVDDQIYFYLIETVQPGTELTVWYHEDLMQRVNFFLRESWKSLTHLTELGRTMNDQRCGMMSLAGLCAQPTYIPTPEELISVHQMRYLQHQSSCRTIEEELILQRIHSLQLNPPTRHEYAPQTPCTPLAPHTPLMAHPHFLFPPLTPASLSPPNSPVVRSPYLPQINAFSPHQYPIPLSFPPSTPGSSVNLESSEEVDVEDLSDGSSSSSSSSSHGRSSDGKSCKDVKKSTERKKVKRGHKLLPYKLKRENGKFIYACDSCPKVLPQLSNLNVHRRKHTGERPFECKICKQRFTQKAHLAKHHFVHTGQRPYSCKLCSKNFTSTSNLKAHEKNHTGEKPYCCDKCPTRFSQRIHLQKHKHAIHGTRDCAADDDEVGPT